MATKKPARRMPDTKKTEAPLTLMGNQDTENKGDSGAGSGKKEKVLMTFWVTPEKREEIKAYARDHDMTASRVIVEGINWRLKQED